MNLSRLAALGLLLLGGTLSAAAAEPSVRQFLRKPDAWFATDEIGRAHV